MISVEQLEQFTHQAAYEASRQVTYWSLRAPDIAKELQEKAIKTASEARRRVNIITSNPYTKYAALRVAETAIEKTTGVPSPARQDTLTMTQPRLVEAATLSDLKSAAKRAAEYEAPLRENQAPVAIRVAHGTTTDQDVVIVKMNAEPIRQAARSAEHAGNETIKFARHTAKLLGSKETRGRYLRYLVTGR